MSEKREFLLDVRDGIATVTFNWPHAVNAMGAEYSAEFERVLDRIEADAAARVVILTGAGRVFNGGGDLFEIMSPEPADRDWELALIRGYNRVAKRIYYFDLPVIAAVNGPAAGGGVGIAAACDFAIAAETARYDLAFHKLGLAAADVGVPWLLHRILGPVLANYYLLTAGSIDAQTGLRLGLFAEVVPPEQLLDTARAAAARIAAAPPETVRISKLSMRHGVAMDFAANLEVEAYLQSFAFQSAGHKRRVAEYRARLAEKRK
jgi:enoyl-CoA hydratase/carnithine racemase